MRARQAAVLASLCVVAAFAACTLNPQPLPPSELGANDRNSDASADAGAFGEEPTNPAPIQDAAPPNGDKEGGAGGGDAGDGGDASDASDASDSG